MKYWISIDDYSSENIEIAEQLRKRDLLATFYIELTSTRATSVNQPSNQINVLHGWGFDIGSHTLNHKILCVDGQLIDKDIAMYQLAHSKDLIEDITSKSCKSFCPPRGRYNGELLSLAEYVGYSIIRSTKVGDIQPIRQGINHTTIHCYPRKEYEGVMWWDLSERMINEVSLNGGCFKLWAHGWELVKYDVMSQFNKVLDLVKERLSD